MTTDSSGFALASSFATMASVFASSSGLYSGTGYFAAGNGADTVSPSGFTSILVGDGSALNYNDITTSGVGIVSGNGNDTITAGANDTIDAGTGSNMLLLATGPESVTTVGFDTIQAVGSVVALNYTNDGASGVVRMAGGTLTVSGSGVGDYYLTGATATVQDSGSDIFVMNQPSIAGGDGSNTFIDASAASGNDQFWAGSGNVTLIGGSGNDTFAGGTGSASVTAGGGSNGFYLFGENAVSTTSMFVTNATSSDFIDLVDFSSTFGYSVSTDGTNTTVAITQGASTGATITLLGVNNTNEVKVFTGSTHNNLT